MKILPFIKDVEKSLSEIYDAALKSAGMPLHSLIQQAIDSVKSDKENPKYLEIHQEMDKNLHIICDAALKNAGMQVHSQIQQLITSISDKPDDLMKTDGVNA